MFLITGGTGFIGGATVRALVTEGYRVRSFDNDSRGSRNTLQDVAREVEFIVGDIRDPQAVATAVRGVDIVCHLAAINGTKNFYSKPDLVLEVAVKGMVNVLDACRIHHVGNLVVMSSSEVYQTPPRIPSHERVPLCIPDPLNPRYSYGAGKILTEMMAIHCTKHFERVCIVRPHNVYGPSMGYDHVIPEFILRMKALCESSPGTIRFPIQGTGTETRAFVYISDMVDGFRRVIDKGEHLGIYHIGTDDEITIAGLVKEIAGHFERQVEVVPGELTAGSTLRRCPDITKSKALGYSPKVSLKEGLAPTIEWYVQKVPGTFLPKGAS